MGNILKKLAVNVVYVGNQPVFPRGYPEFRPEYPTVRQPTPYELQMQEDIRKALNSTATPSALDNLQDTMSNPWVVGGAGLVGGAGMALLLKKLLSRGRRQ